uniref:Zona pellucida sperm-binding protein 3 n=2 Tax=Xiphophorus couchianus TaxID=32473 RepID=A0A3B5LVM2_9TELE
MGFAVLSVVWLLIISLVFRVSDAIRTLKEGPMIDAEGREYKSVSLDDFSRPNPDSKTTVRVECTEVSMIIFIQAGFYNNGRQVSPQELFLGDAKYWKDKQCQAVNAGDGEYVIEADLQDCGSKLMVTGINLIYSNNLMVSPAVGSLGVTRATEAVVPVSCHYKRYNQCFHFFKVSHGKLFIFSEVENWYYLFIYFSLNGFLLTGTGNDCFLCLHADDWSGEKYSNTVYLVGIPCCDPRHLEVSYTGLEQRKLFINFCVVTLTADFTSVPRYCFIENHGCFLDARDGGVNSIFKPRSTTSKLQFQFDAFLFQDDLRNILWKSSPTNKVCNYINSSWKNVDGPDVCQCCKGICSTWTSKGKSYLELFYQQQLMSQYFIALHIFVLQMIFVIL